MKFGPRLRVGMLTGKSCSVIARAQIDVAKREGVRTSPSKSFLRGS